MSDSLITPEETIQSIIKTIADGDKAIDYAKSLCRSTDPKNEKKGKSLLLLNHEMNLKNNYVIGQITWRLNLGNPTEFLRAVLQEAALTVEDADRYAIKLTSEEFYFADLAAFISIILSGRVSQWLLPYQRDISKYTEKQKKLTPWEVNLGAHTAIIYALVNGCLPDCWDKIMADSMGRAGLKLIHRYNDTYERLLKAVWSQSWIEIPSLVNEVNDNYRKRASSERSYADVFGDGPYNSESIDFIAASIFRIGQKYQNFPDIPQSTHHVWNYGDVDIEDIYPHIDIEKG